MYAIRLIESGGIFEFITAKEDLLILIRLICIIILQVNYLDWENESIQSGKCYEVAKKHNKPVIVMEPI